ncbi:unnamed protein product [Candidula unifasciata]|uniref:Major facilitator superfamily (MFS) profile domain-containing protein n=1 Tax=Candidula unifasciata TaxID=100452 RepID=A0A8S4A1T9_9EUPU|nr:unnamed protein product [Candidula unifasciata]
MENSDAKTKTGAESLVENTTLKDFNDTNMSNPGIQFVERVSDKIGVYSREEIQDKAADTDMDKSEHESGSKLEGDRGDADTENNGVAAGFENGDLETAGTSEVKDTVAWKVPDGGWGWVIVLSALIISLIVDGLTYTFGVLLGELERVFQEPKSTISLASSLQVGLYLFIGPVVSALTNRFGCRRVIIAGSLVAAFAFIVSSWSTNVTMLIMTYGVIGGIGFGLMYLPAIVAVSVYFEERRAFATGIAVCGSGIGTFILAPLTDFLLDQYNWSWTLLLLGGLILNGVVFGALVRPLELQIGAPSRDKCKTRSEALEDGELVRYRGALKKTPGASTNGVTPQEAAPLITLKNEQDRTSVITTRAKNTDKSTRPPMLFFHSTPNMQNINMSSLSSTGIKDKKQKSSEKVASVDSQPTDGRPRSNTLELLKRVGSPKVGLRVDKTPATGQPRPRAHAPLGLAFISLSDANLNRIREDVQLPFSRKDIHLSGPLASAEPDDNSQAINVKNMRSLTSLAGMDGQASAPARPRGIWACLPSSARDTLEEMLSVSILKDKRYWFVLMGNFFCMIGFYVPFVYVPDRAKQIGIEEDSAAFLLSIIGITNTVGRVLTGVVINFLNIDCLLVTSVALALAGVVTAAFPLCLSYTALATLSAVFGVCVAAYISLCSVLLCELLGVENLTNAFGFVILFRGVACIMGPPIAGALIDATGIFDPSFYIGGGFIVLGAVSHALLLIPCCRRKTSRSV